MPPFGSLPGSGPLPLPPTGGAPCAPGGSAVAATAAVRGGSGTVGSAVVAAWVAVAETVGTAGAAGGAAAAWLPFCETCDIASAPPPIRMMAHATPPMPMSTLLAVLSTGGCNDEAADIEVRFEAERMSPAPGMEGIDAWEGRAASASTAPRMSCCVRPRIACASACASRLLPSPDASTALMRAARSPSRWLATDCTHSPTSRCEASCTACSMAKAMSRADAYRMLGSRARPRMTTASSDGGMPWMIVLGQAMLPSSARARSVTSSSPSTSRRPVSISQSTIDAA